MIFQDATHITSLKLVYYYMISLKLVQYHIMPLKVAVNCLFCFKFLHDFQRHNSHYVIKTGLLLYYTIKTSTISHYTIKTTVLSILLRKMFFTWRFILHEIIDF